MIYLSKLNTGFLLLTRQLFSGRVSSLLCFISGWTFNYGLLFLNFIFCNFIGRRFRAGQASIPHLHKAPLVVGNFVRPHIKTQISMTENLSDFEHNKILNNKSADLVSRLTTFIEYCNIGFDRNEALRMSNVTEQIITGNKELFDEISNSMKEENFDDMAINTGIPNDLNKAYGKIMDNYAVYLDITKNHDETVKRLSEMFGVNTSQLNPFINQHKEIFLKENYPQFLPLVKVNTETAIPTLWNGYCPESWTNSKTVRMRLNKMDFYESEETGLQIAIGFPGVQAVILKHRGNRNFTSKKIYADERDCNECLSPQTLEQPPFCEPTIFKSSNEIKDYIKSSVLSKISRVEFDKSQLETMFDEVETLLFDKSKIRNIIYCNKDCITDFDKNNKEFLNDINKKSVVYCIWLGSSISDLRPYYIGHVFETISKQRMIAHFSRKNKATGSQLEKIKIAIKDNMFLGATFVQIAPAYMRTSIEEWLIEKYAYKLAWNIKGKRKK